MSKKNRFDIKIDKETLEDVLKKIDKLGEDLSAEIVYQEEEGHMEKEEYYPPGHSRYGSCDSYEVRDVWAVTQERIAEPDLKKRRAAEKELTEIFEGSPWYSARYLAGQHLMVAEGYNLGKRLHEESRLAVLFAHNFHILMHSIEDKDMLKELKHDFNVLYSIVSPPHIREEMCRIMDYSIFRYIAMEHPIAAKAAGITATVGAISGIIYGLIEYIGG